MYFCFILIDSQLPQPLKSSITIIIITNSLQCVAVIQTRLYFTRTGVASLVDGDLLISVATVDESAAFAHTRPSSLSTRGLTGVTALFISDALWWPNICLQWFTVSSTTPVVSAAEACVDLESAKLFLWLFITALSVFTGYDVVFKTLEDLTPGKRTTAQVYR